MAEQSNLVKSPFTISKSASGATYLTVDLATSGSLWYTLLSYQVPLGMAIEITPANYHFGSYYATTGVTAGDKITSGGTRLIKSNANDTETRELWSGPNSIFLNIGDELQRPKFRIPVVANASQKVVVQVTGLSTTLDVSTSDYTIECMQYYEEI